MLNTVEQRGSYCIYLNRREGLLQIKRRQSLWYTARLRRQVQLSLQGNSLHTAHTLRATSTMDIFYTQCHFSLSPAIYGSHCSAYILDNNFYPILIHSSKSCVELVQKQMLKLLSRKPIKNRLMLDERRILHRLLLVYRFF